MAEIFSALQVYLGSLYVNDFNRNGRTWQVNVQADARYRKQVDDLKQLKVRNDRGGMVPLATVASARCDQRPGDDPALQHVPRGAGQRRRPRASAPARPSGRWRTRPSGSSSRSTP